MSCLDVFNFIGFWGLPNAWRRMALAFSSFHCGRITNLERPTFPTCKVFFIFLHNKSLHRLEKCHPYSLITLNWWICFDLSEATFLLKLITTFSCQTPQCFADAVFHYTDMSLFSGAGLFLVREYMIFFLSCGMDSCTVKPE